VDSLPKEGWRDSLFEADLAITGTDALIAETGTVVLAARPSEPRSLSLLPPIHIVVAEQSQIVSDLFDLFASLQTTGTDERSPGLPSCLTLITGPSKTGDIELKLVTGVHGPGEVHVVLISGAAADTGRASESGICSPPEVQTRGSL
jgi:L-lactate dehydrogenase complex protein LldG